MSSRYHYRCFCRSRITNYFCVHLPLHTLKVATSALTTLGLILLVGLYCPVKAQSTNSTVTLSPPFSQLTLPEGSSEISQSLELTNTTETGLEFSAAVFLFSQVDSQGTTILTDKPPSSDSVTIADSITVTPATFVVNAGQTQTLTVTVKNQLNLAPGGHYAAIVIRSTTESSTGTQSVVPALSSFLLVRKVGGEQYHLSLGKVSLFDSLFHLDFPRSIPLLFENQGNIHVIPRGTVSISDIWGRRVMEGTINEGSLLVLPRGQREIDVAIRTIRPLLPSLAYTITIQGRSEPGDVKFTQTGVIFILDAPTVVILLCPLLAVALVLSWKQSRRKR